MDKKLMAFLAFIAVGGVLLGTTAYAEISGTSGYDVYKQALVNTYDIESVTPKTEITLKDNGKLAYKVNLLAETVQENQKMSEIQGLVDAAADYLPNYILVNSSPDGTKEVSLQMSGNQVLPIINVFASMMVENLGNDKGHGGDDFNSVLADSLKGKLPKLVEDIRVSRIEVNAKINKENLILEQSENLVLAGTDENGHTHEVLINIATVFSDNNTAFDKIDLDVVK